MVIEKGRRGIHGNAQRERFLIPTGLEDERG